MSDIMECLFIEINQPNNKNILLSVVYRPRSGDHSVINLFNLEICGILKHQ